MNCRYSCGPNHKNMNTVGEENYAPARCVPPIRIHA